MRSIFLWLSLVGPFAMANGMHEFPIWKFVRAGHTSYIVATHHVASLKLQEIPQLLELVQNAEVLLLESDFATEVKRDFYRTTDDPAFQLDPESEIRVQIFLDSRLNIADDRQIKSLRNAISMYKPQVFFARLFAFLMARESHGGPSFDSQIRRAATPGVPIYPLDRPFVLERTFLNLVTVRDVNEVLTEIFLEDGSLSKSYKRTQKTRRAAAEGYARNYRNLKVDRQTKKIELATMSPALRRLVEKIEPDITKRHEQWIQKILAVTKDNASLIAVGFSHVVDTDFPGLLTLLKPYGELTKIILPMACEWDLENETMVESD
jgi:uncharacterized protein YbaP (TraB family)